MRRIAIKKVVINYKKLLTPDHRYSSFDYCYNYFLNTKNVSADIQRSCLMLGFYLASWGMLRGSSFLLQKSVKHFEPAIRYISTLDNSVWKIDVDNYNEKNIQTIIKIYSELKKALITDLNADVTLITKVMLGVFGFIPAYDSYFCKTFQQITKGLCSFRKLNMESLIHISNFYKANKSLIDKLSSETYTTDFNTGKKTKINYPKAKIIDMYGFSYAQL